MSTVVEHSNDYGNSSVRTRISWGAILAGAAVAMAIYAMLISLGVAIGLSVSGDINSRTMGTNAGIWGFVSLLIALFIGGWVTTQVTVGESRTEAVLYGIVLWATTSVLLLYLAANGMRVGMDTAAAMQSMTSENTAAAVETPQTLEERQVATYRARETGRQASWWAFAGIFLSMVAAIVGALVGPIELTVRRENRRFRDQHTTARDQHTPQI